MKDMGDFAKGFKTMSRTHTISTEMRMTPTPQATQISSWRQSIMTLTMS